MWCYDPLLDTWINTSSKVVIFAEDMPWELRP